MAHNCFYKDQICHHYGKHGHIQQVCRSKQQGKPKQAAKTPEVHAVGVDVDVGVDVNVLMLMMSLSHLRGTQCK